jgi:hypothetical protein
MLADDTRRRSWVAWPALSGSIATMDQHRQTATRAAETLGFLDGNGELIRLDSLMVVDLVVALEEASGAEIPLGTLGADAFNSLDNVAQMLAGLDVKTKSP